MKDQRWRCVGLAVVLAVCGMLGVALAAEEVQDAPMGQLWTERPVLPWDSQAVGEGDWAGLLDAKLDISRRGKEGETRHYRIRRENVMYDRIGHPASRTLAQATIERRLLRETEPGWWAERVTWTDFKAHSTQAPGEVPAPQEVPGAAGLSYEFLPKAFDYVNIPADFSGIADPMAAYLVKVMAMDLMGFDALTTALRDRSGDAVQVGMTSIDPRWQQGIDITQPTSVDPAGRYLLNELIVSVAGVTRRGGQPCLLVWFAAEGNDVNHDFSAGPVTMKFRGTEHFWGEMAISLRDGHVVGGELRGPLPWKMEMGMGGQPPQEMPVFGVIQQVSVWEVPAPPAQ